MIRKRTYTGRLWTLLLTAVLMTATQALDLSAYRPSRNDAIRNGVMLSYGRGSGQLAAVVMPVGNNTCTNVYDFAVVPDGSPMAEVHRAGYCTWYLPADGVTAAAPGDTLVLPFTITDASRLDSAVILGGDRDRISRISNRVVLGLTGAGNETGMITDLVRDVNDNGIPDENDISLKPQEALELLPGDTLRVLVSVAVPYGGGQAWQDTVSLECATQRVSPSGERLTRVYSNVIRVGGAAAMYTAVSGDHLYKNELNVH